jgi:hypothetical protein
VLVRPAFCIFPLPSVPFSYIFRLTPLKTGATCSSETSLNFLPHYVSPYPKVLHRNRRGNLKRNACLIFRKIPPFTWLSCCWSNERLVPDNQGRSVRYTHTNTDTSIVTDTVTSSARRLNTVRSSTGNTTPARHIQLRLPAASNSANPHNIQAETSIM